MEQVPTQKIESECGKAKLFIANDMSLGNLHDFLLSVKGEMIDRMVKVQKEEDEKAVQERARVEAQEEAEEVKPEAVEAEEAKE